MVISYRNIAKWKYGSGEAMAEAALNPAQLEIVAGLFGVLAEPTRLALLQALRGRPMAVGEIVEGLGAKQANVSKQLGILFDAGFLGRERQGNTVRYFIADPMVFRLCELVCDKLKTDAEREYKAFGGKVRR
jgi:DNA-binding transcriptional ArsR family regulator